MLVESKGDFSSTSATNLLGSLEAAGATVRIWLETELGVGHLAMHCGQIVTAEVGPLRNRTALLRVLTLTEGSYSVEWSDVPPGPSIVANVETALQVLNDRQQEWRTLCETSPAMSSVLRLTQAGRAAKRESTGAARIAYLLVDGSRTILDILGESELDPIEALRAIVRGVEFGYFEDIDNSASLLPLPIEAVSDDATKIPAAPLVPRFQPTRDVARRPSQLTGLRKETLSGLGVDSVSSSPPPQSQDGGSLRASPIIEIASDASDLHLRDAGPMAAGARHPRELETCLAASEPLAISEPADTLLGNARPSSDGVSSASGAAVRHVGRYEIIHRIGRGGMGSVYLARLTARGGFRRLFALKLLRSHLARDSAAAEAFLAEARLAGQLHHPNVVGVVDAGVHEGQPYLVMDYVEGCSLKQLMTAHPDSRPPRLIVPIILGAMEGLSSVHNLRSDDGSALDVVHCDISPENLLVGADGICRLTDFGVARRAQLGDVRNIHGKPGYVAPEQVTGGTIDKRADIFALGVVLWSALTGERLFLASTVEETLHRVCTQSIAPPSMVGLRPLCAFDHVCEKALERDLGRRYSTVEEMQADLRTAAMKEGLIGLNSEVSSWVRRTVGQQLSQRRLLVLEASRPSELSMPHSPLADSGQPSFGVGMELQSSVPPSRQFVELGDEPESRTMPLRAVSQTGRARQLVLVVAALLAGGMVVVAILWPSTLARLFKMDSQASLERGGAKPIQLEVQTVSPKAPSLSTKGPTVTPVLNSAEAPPAIPGNSKEQEGREIRIR